MASVLKFWIKKMKWNRFFFIVPMMGFELGLEEWFPKSLSHYTTESCFHIILCFFRSLQCILPVDSRHIILNILTVLLQWWNFLIFLLVFFFDKKYYLSIIVATEMLTQGQWDDNVETMQFGVQKLNNPIPSQSHAWQAVFDKVYRFSGAQ
jgi:hypothetical protein